ncbi:tax1-binding protein 3 homolog isoform X1 [Watersipora subatra]|uniref:tax1-binding protein 3 homolog isoform X1 n=1 Tax=Watersipora subatra TaxID=2589382 RepID=UPI00355B0C95
MSLHVAGNPLNIYGIPLTLQKTQEFDKYGSPVLDSSGKPQLKCGFRIGGGIDQDPSRCPHGYPDKGIYITYVEERSAADMAGLLAHDKILQVNGIDFTMITHEKACSTIRKDPILQIIVYRKDVQDAYDAKSAGSHASSVSYQGYDQLGHDNSFISAPNSSFATPDKYS